MNPDQLTDIIDCLGDRELCLPRCRLFIGAAEIAELFVGREIIYGFFREILE